MKISWILVTLFIYLFVQTVKTVENKKYTYDTKYIEVPLDHFRSQNPQKTFKMRYLFKDMSKGEENPPIFFYTGNEANVEVYAQNTGFMWELAQKFHAIVIFAEHRYYGLSFPFAKSENSLDSSKLVYLKSHQAIADYVDLVKYLKTQPKMKNSPVITFGGSYGGMLSAFMRKKHSDVVDGAISSSAPIRQLSGKVDCELFYRKITDNYRNANSICPTLIRRSWSEIDKITQNSDGLHWLSKNWNLCNLLKNADDVIYLKIWLRRTYETLAFVNYPYAGNFVAPLPANPISEVCKHLSDQNLSGKPLLLRLFKAISVFTNFTHETKCNFANENGKGIEGNLWYYQICTELTLPICSNGIKDMFEPVSWDMKGKSDECNEVFHVRPTLNFMCKEYGCDDLSTASNIIFSNGLNDPWYEGGILENVSPTVLAYRISDATHHFDLRGSNEADPQSVREARKFEEDHIGQWIKGKHH